MIRPGKRLIVSVVVLPALVGMFAAGPARAADPEGCLTCHRYRGLARVAQDGQKMRLFYVDPNYYDRVLGPHARLKCSDCHERTDFEVIPHRTPTPVDCARSCHLASPEKLESRFSHDRIGRMLDGSIHTRAVLARCNELLGRPLADGQARCLLCHDEPTFRRAGQGSGAAIGRDLGAQNWAEQEAPIRRCAVCHRPGGGAPPMDTRQYYWHVHARSMPARDNQDTVRVCALCHSDPRVRRHFNLPDATASYLTSFHGKATLLGYQQTAHCLDCHVGPMENVHVMRRHDQPDSPTSPENVADTCRSPRCHPQAGRQVTSAAVHLQLATSRGAEYLIACVFIVMILTTFGPSLLLTALEMAHAALGRHDPQHQAHRDAVRRLMGRPGGAEALRRFTPHQRVQHWLLVGSFVTLVVTGFPMKFADTRWAAWLIGQMGGLGAARLAHRIGGVVLLAGFFYHGLYVAGHVLRQRRQTGEGFVRIFLQLPMVMNLGDLKKMGQLVLYLVGLRKHRPATGRFSPEEKFEYFGVFWGCCLLGATGVLMWASAWTSRHLPGRTLTIANVIHTFEAFLALLHVGVVHMVTVIFAPSVFPCSPAMFTGNTGADEMAERHSAMIAEVEARLAAEEEEEAGYG